MISKLMLISHNGFWRVSVTIPLSQKMMLKLKGLSGHLNLMHWVKVKGNASIDVCKKPYFMHYTITCSDSSLPFLTSPSTLVNPPQNYYLVLSPWRSHAAASAAGNTMLPTTTTSLALSGAYRPPVFPPQSRSATPTTTCTLCCLRSPPW